MSPPSERIRCDDCGHFVGFTELAIGYASRRLLTPDSDCSREEYETLYWQCNPGRAVDPRCQCAICREPADAE